METMKNFFSSFTFLVGFMILCIFTQMILGKQFLNKFLWLVLFGIAITNADNFMDIIKNAGKVQGANATQTSTGTSETPIAQMGGTVV